MADLTVKDYQRKEYELWALNTVMDDNGKVPYPSRPLLAEWVKGAWDKVKPRDIVRSFVKAGITCPEDYSEQLRAEYNLYPLYPNYPDEEV